MAVPPGIVFGENEAVPAFVFFPVTQTGAYAIHKIGVKITSHCAFILAFLTGAAHKPYRLF